jgi:hypothetical protein
MNLQAVHRTPCSEIPYTRTVSPSVHPCPASGGAADFFLASALRHQQALRPPGVKDARCIRPISATQTKLRVPAPRDVPGSLSPLSRRGCPTESWAPYGVTGGQDVSRRPRTASADRHRHVTFELQPHGLGHEAWALSSHGMDATEPLTSLSRSLVHPPPLPSSWELLVGRALQLLARDHGSENAEERQDHP